MTETQEPSLQLPLHAPPCANNSSWNSHTRRRRFLALSSDLGHTRPDDGLVVPWSTSPENLVLIRHHTRHLGFHTPKNSCWCHLTSPDDVIKHASPSPRLRHVIGWHQRLCCPIRDPTRTMYPLTLTWTSWLWLWLFALTFDQNSKFPYSVFRVNSNFGLRFFIWNSKIGQLAHSSLWFLQRHCSWYFQVIFSYLVNLKPLSSFRLEFEGGC